MTQSILSRRLNRAVNSLLVALGITCVATTMTATEITLTLTHPEATGPLYLAVFDSETDFPETMAQGHIFRAKGEKTTLSLSLAPGTYAISIFLDQNNDGELNTNFVGIPNEPIGAVKDNVGRPSWEKSHFIVTDEPSHYEATVSKLF